MITIETLMGKYVVTPTIFPDGTSQVWKLPNEVTSLFTMNITWNFESEREIIDLFSLRVLTGKAKWHLHIPYLPYARQDKEGDNDSTFNLTVFAHLINELKCTSVYAVDVHNHSAASDLIHNFHNIDVTDLQNRAIGNFEADVIAFPDSGAFTRYGNKLNMKTLIFEKKRNQATGAIEGHKLTSFPTIDPYAKVLIVDDLCDGGATFISVAKALHEVSPDIEVGLYVTHGVFSRGREHLLNNGITRLYFTNSLPKNFNDGYEV